MKLHQILVPILSFALGWLVVSTIRGGSGDLEEELAAAKAEIVELKKRSEVEPSEPEKLTSLPSALATSEEEPAPEVVETEEEEVAEDPAAAIASLLNSKEARTLMKRMSTGFAQRGEQWVERGIAEYTEKLNLTDDQVARLKEKLGKNLADQTAEFTAKLDNESMSMQEIMVQQREVMEGQEEVMAEILKEELTEDQYAKFEREQLEEKTQRVQRDADRELERLDGDLELSNSQKDQVFGILVQKNSDYDESMAIEGADAEVNLADDVTKEDAIRAVLDEKQSADYDKSLEERQTQRRGWGGFGGGGFGR